MLPIVYSMQCTFINNYAHYFGMTLTMYAVLCTNLIIKFAHCMKPSKVKVPQCQQLYIWHCGIVVLWPAVQSMVVVVLVMHRPRRLLADRSNLHTTNIVIAWASLVPHYGYAALGL